jgi:polyphosphate glucokinase
MPRNFANICPYSFYFEVIMDILGIDIGGTGIKGAVVDTVSGELKTERIRLLTPQPATPEAIADTVSKLVEQIGFDGPIACGFPSRVIHGVVKTAANIDKSWINVPVEDLFSTRLGRKVYVANDADVAGLAELHFGAAKDVAGTVLFLTLGTGIGSCIFVDGTFCPNTELGHLKFHGDSAERYCSGLVKEKEDLKWKDWGVRLNEYLHYVNFLLCPDLIVLGGGASKKFDKYAEVLDVDVEVKPAQMLNLAGIVGAGMYGALRAKQA